MSTAAAAVQLDEDMDPLNLKREINAADGDTLTIISPFKGTEDQQKAQARFERLIATRLALQLMAQIRANRTNLYAPKLSVSPTDLGYDMSLDYLMNELEKIARLISEMKPENIPWGIMLSENDSDRKKELGRRIEQLTAEFREGRSFLPDYIMAFVKLVAEYKLGPPLESYVSMMRAFSMWSRNSAMAALVENAIWDGRQPLDSYTLSNVFFRLGSDFDAQRLIKFLNTISKKSSFPKPTHPWIQTQVDDIRIAVPVSRSAYLLSALIRATLCNKQQSFAEAYGAVFFDRHAAQPHSGVHKWHVVTSFLTSYADWGSWNAGQRWLQTAVIWADDLYEAGSYVLGRVILRMLDFCVACDRQDEYELIMSAAISAGFSVPEITLDRPARFSARMGQIRLDWAARTKDIPRNDKQPTRQKENVAEFRKLLHNRFDTDQIAKSTKAFHPSESSFRTGPFQSTSVASESTEAPERLEIGPTKEEDVYQSPYFRATVHDALDESLDGEERSMARVAAKTQNSNSDYTASIQQQFLSDSQSRHRRLFSSVARPRTVTLPTELVKQFADGTHWVPAYNYTVALDRIAELEASLNSVGVDVDVEDIIGNWRRR